MSLTPSIWLDPISVTDPLTSFGSGTEVIGLSNGNILVYWNESDNTIAPAPSTDVVGVIYDAQGNNISGFIQINAGVAQNGYEGYVSAAATSDGGFVVAYEHHSLSGTDEDILFSRFDASGTRTQASYIENDTNDPDLKYWEPSITARDDGTFFVSYQSRANSGLDSSIWGRIIDADGVAGPLLIVENDDFPTTYAENYNTSVSATLTDGTVVTVFVNSDDVTDDLLMSSVNPDGSLGMDGYLASFSDAASRSQPDIAALSGGGFVVTYTRSDGDIEAVIWEASGNGIGTTINVSGSASNYFQSSVVGLPDGGFFIAYLNGAGQNVFGQRFDASGNAVGYTEAYDLYGPGLNLDLTSDGRIAVTLNDNVSYETVFMILDPRDDSFTLEPGSGEATTRLEGGTVFGAIGADTIYGQAGRDSIYGMSGSDTLYGGQNRDFLGGGAGNDFMYGGQGNDVFAVGSAGDVVVELGGQGVDTVRSTVDYTLDTHVENLNLLGTQNLKGYGNVKDNAMLGNEGRNLMFGLGGDDTIRGYDNRDQLIGNNGADRLFGMQGQDVLRGDLGADELYGGAGADRFVYRSASDSKVNVSQRDTIKDFTRGADKIDLRQIDASDDISGDQQFEFIGNGSFDGDDGIGQVRVHISALGAIVAVDVDGDGSSDMQIFVEGATALSASDFIL